MRIAVPNAIIFVLDPNHGGVEVPEYSGLVSVSSSCVSIGTQAEVDGETNITLDREISDGLSCVFDGEIHTSNGAIAVVTAQNSQLARLEGLGVSTRFSVWVDDVNWPSRVSVVVPH